MSWFKRKQPPSPEPKPCQHMWRDFPWYMECERFLTSKGEPAFSYSIYEPYVCVICGERVDKLLARQSLTFGSRKGREAYIREIENRYRGKLRPRAEVEDMINDQQLVDRQKLYFFDRIHVQKEDKNGSENQN